jgi:hypothetical protein
MFWLRLVLFLCLCACAAPREGSLQWVSERYGSALLRSDTETMRRYTALGVGVQEAQRNPNAAALHVIKLCTQGMNEKKTRANVLLLIGGSINGIVHGIDMVLVKEFSVWRVRDARLSVDQYGAPRVYLRNCVIDPHYTYQ